MLSDSESEDDEYKEYTFPVAPPLSPTDCTLSDEEEEEGSDEGKSHSTNYFR